MQAAPSAGLRARGREGILCLSQRGLAKTLFTSPLPQFPHEMDELGDALVGGTEGFRACPQAGDWHGRDHTHTLE